MRRLYTFLFYLILPLILVRLWWKGRKLPEYKQRITERFMWQKAPSEKVDVWLHAVSYGEVVAAIPLVDEMLAAGRKILITTMTPTGSERVKSRFGEKVLHQYIPYDFPWVLKRFYAAYRIKVGVIMETELWPNLLYLAKKNAIPLLLVNARISDKAMQKYEKFKFLFKSVLACFTKIMTQSEEDSHRFKVLGASEEIVHMTGNIKFDMQIKIPSLELCHLLKEKWGTERAVMLAASTHDNEEKQLLTYFSKLKTNIPHALLAIAPRHPERFQLVYNLCLQMGFKTGLRSIPDSITPDIEIVVLDSMGELLGFYQVSDYAFVGGSLVPIGGHNVLEPIAMNVPVFTGPYIQNSRSICEDLNSKQAMQILPNAEEIMKAITELHLNQDRKEQQIKNANKVLQENKGSLAKYLHKIEELLG